MALFFKIIGSIIIAIGFILAAMIWSDAGSTPAGRMAGHYAWIGGGFSGLFFLGFGQILELLAAIRDRIPVPEAGQKLESSVEARMAFASELRASLLKNGGDWPVTAEGVGNTQLRLVGLPTLSQRVYLDPTSATMKAAKSVGFRQLIIIGNDGVVTERAL